MNFRAIFVLFMLSFVSLTMAVRCGHRGAPRCKARPKGGGWVNQGDEAQQAQQDDVA